MNPTMKKIQASELPSSGKTPLTPARNLARIAPFIAFPLLFITVFVYCIALAHFYPKKFPTVDNAFQYRSLNRSNNSAPVAGNHSIVNLKNPPNRDINNRNPAPIAAGDDRRKSEETVMSITDKNCNLFTGQWVRNHEGEPYYTNATCHAIQEHQNCLKFERPDTDYLKWKWKPDGCELPAVDPSEFLQLVRGKAMAFVGDSVARNQLQSLVCILSKVTYPRDLSDPLDQNRRYEYREYNFNVSLFWSPYLVKTGGLTDDQRRPFNLYLDEFDPLWPNEIARFDYVIISAGHWFFRPTYFYVDRLLVGCLYCTESTIRQRSAGFSYRRAFRTAFRAIIEAEGFNGVVFLRTFSPSHFEGGRWNKGGSCPRTLPFGRNESAMADYTADLYGIQLEELRIAERTAGNRHGGEVKLRAMDVTKAMQMRPDGHPSKYWQRPGANPTFGYDCVHWCLPGAIDTWNEFLMELLKREELNTTSYVPTQLRNKTKIFPIRVLL
ncbi:protein trichome birefringence-like 19 [Andrographis paniculata]|uniref:protein trichome birefringence-like 19 n=1 Tax=Andrographis paniculata TaxID=175694 RepID=UPI0021E8F343|nr:protein trichome birefringence-like 19 [Andrographis paniculata]